LEPNFRSTEKASAQIPGRGTSLRNLFLVKGLLSAEAMRMALRWFDDDATVCVEAHSLEGIGTPVKLHHLSEFGPENGEPSSREVGRQWVTQLSETVLKSTGKPVWKSFEYKGVSAWWFIEIVFQEPSYLVARRKQAIEKAASMLAGGLPHKDLIESDVQQLPVVPPPESAKPHYKLRERVKNRLRRLLQLRFLFSVKRSDVLCLIEAENLRCHVNVNDGSFRSVLPYAEGVIEELHSQLGDQCLVLPRRPGQARTDGWEFLGPALPPLIYEPLPSGFEVALKEVAALAQPIMRGYLTPETLREVMIFRLAEYRFYLELLARVKPKVVFAYNWEGVFRPLTTAARVRGCRIVGVQQALGPYLHALNHRETGYFHESNPQGFATPTKVALWGPLHQQEFLTYGYARESIEVTGYARLDKHFHVKSNKQQVRRLACGRLGLNPEERYLLFTGQSRVLDTSILRAEHFVGAIKTLCRLAQEFGFKIIIKPWTSDDMSMVEQAAQANPGLVFVAPQNALVSNADLLSVSDWLVGTFSSIIGEATLAGNACVLLNYPEARYYFDLPHVEHYRPMIPFVDEAENLESVLRPLIESESVRTAHVSKAQGCMHDVFGPCDGQAAKKIAQLVLEEKEAFLGG
jgi:hypothetical protein